jgi:hypothetical protein
MLDPFFSVCFFTIDFLCLFQSSPFANNTFGDLFFASPNNFFNLFVATLFVCFSKFLSLYTSLAISGFVIVTTNLYIKVVFTCLIDMLQTYLRFFF